ncbi:hypothetical protein [Streptomyces sp. NRRL F-2580]|uniref:hypothetical protein n=1 Tax=Streptomyces sp. NRRL F-2580 TaxID=1463841 RepID=UPI00131A6535|nr:hypothetical protein [Streptomyces sp. NRRL F-2580]
MHQEPQAGRGTALEALAPSIVKVGKHAGTLRAGVHKTVYVWTREDISTAVNAGVDLVAEELAGSERDQDLMNMVVNAVLHVLENPNASLDEVIRENYEEEPEEVRSWWSGW